MEYYLIYDRNNNIANLPLTQFYGATLTREVGTIDTLEFNISGYEPCAALLELEGYIQNEFGKFVIKEISNREDNQISVYCEADIGGLKSVMFKNYNQNLTLQKHMEKILTTTAPNWKCVNHTQKKWTQAKTLTEDATKTGFEIIQSLISVDCYNVEILYDAANTTIHLYDVGAMGTNRGTYFFEDVNLLNFEIESNSSDFATRIYPYGKDGLTISGAKRKADGSSSTTNYGKEYIDNNSYSTKRIDYIWSDDRYTSANTLFDDAFERLKQISKPVTTYKMTVADLYRVDNTNGNIFQFDLGDTVMISAKGQELKQRVVKIYHNLDNPEATEVELSSAIKNLAVSDANRSKQIVDINATLGTNKDVLDNLTGNIQGIEDVVDAVDKKVEDLEIKVENSVTGAFVQGNTLTSSQSVLNLKIGDYLLKQIKVDKYDAQEWGNFFENGHLVCSPTAASAQILLKGDNVDWEYRNEGNEPVNVFTNRGMSAETIKFKLTNAIEKEYPIEQTIDELKDTHFFGFSTRLTAANDVKGNIQIKINNDDANFPTETILSSTIGRLIANSEFINSALYENPASKIGVGVSVEIEITIPANSIVELWNLNFKHSVIGSDIDFVDTRTFSWFFQPVEITQQEGVY